ncbi:YpiF family protein [Bacillus multifaciens]|uniref:YpiF family protein n=1 Tax=Bacillus multifaciens TaxID=3068506 RepID=UPI0027426B12|nr:YpiF family protein [Bacillus sp. WLY-B-L8]MDP7978433.1 YpiF family protein [Bacillus sp. WLY-B-L8]HDX9587891.1 YpiF family protein [Bacillus pseudomycoides]
MKWAVADVEQYEKTREYIDTGIIPLLSVSFEKGMKTAAVEGEFISTLTRELEREYKGRVFLLPSFTYVEGTHVSERQRLCDWTNYLKEKGLRHIALITSDFSWKEFEYELAEQLFCLPALPLDQLSDQAKREIIYAQIKNIMEILTEKWENK